MTAFFFLLITTVYISLENQVMKIFKNLKTDIFIQKNCDSFYSSLIVKVLHMLSVITILHMTDSLARIHFPVMHYCLPLLGLLSLVNHWRLSLTGERNQKEKVIARNHTITSMTEAFLNGNTYFQWITWDSYVQFFNVLIKTFHVSRSVLKKNTFNRNSVSTGKMWGLVVLFWFSLQSVDVAFKEKTWQNCFEICWALQITFTEAEQA